MRKEGRGKRGDLVEIPGEDQRSVGRKVRKEGGEEKEEEEEDGNPGSTLSTTRNITFVT